MRSITMWLSTAMAIALMATLGFSQANDKKDPSKQSPASKKLDKKPADVISPDGTDKDDPRIARLPLKREGSYELGKTARLAPASPEGSNASLAWKLEFEDPKLRPMFVMPCQLLEDMEQIQKTQAAAGKTVKFQVSGQIFIYHNENYFLPTLIKQLPDLGNLQK